MLEFTQTTSSKAFVIVEHVMSTIVVIVSNYTISTDKCFHVEVYVIFLVIRSV